MDPKENPLPLHVIEVKVPKAAEKGRMTELLKQEIEKDTDIVERSEYLIVRFQKFSQPTEPE